MEHRAIESKQDPQVENLKTLQYLLDNDLAKHPTIARLADGAARTGDFRELYRYMDLNKARFDAVTRMQMIEKNRTEANPFYPFPSGDELATLSGPIKLGIINSGNGQYVWFGVSPQSLSMHSMILGRSGSGKTSYLFNFTIESIKYCQQTGEFNVFIPDTKITYRRLINKIPDLKVITFNKFIFNPLQVPDLFDPRDYINLFCRIFTADNLLHLPSENLISEALHILYKVRSIFDGSSNYPTFNDLFNTILRMQNSKTFGWRYRDIYEGVLNRVRSYTDLKNFSRKIGIRLQTFSKYSMVWELPSLKLGNNIHNFCVSLVANALEYYNMLRNLRGKLLNLIIIDEARTIMEANRLIDIQPGILPVITTGREYGIGLVFCSQEEASFNDTLKSNTYTKILFPLTYGKDLDNSQAALGLSEEMRDFIFKLPPQRTAVVRYAPFERPFLLVAPELSDLDHVPDDSEVEAAMQSFYDEIIPKEDNAVNLDEYPSVQPEDARSPAEIDADIMIEHLINAPFLSYRALINELHLTPSRGDQARAHLVKSGFAKVRSIVLRKGKPGEYFELTEKAYKKFGASPPAGKGGFVHKAFCNCIKDYAEANGFNARIEGVMAGTAKAIDVLAWKEGIGMIGYEVTLHFENLISNLVQDLATTLRTVVVVCRNKDDLRKAMAKVRGNSIPTNRLEFKSIFDFSHKQGE